MERCPAVKTSTGKTLQPRNAAVSVSSFAGSVAAAGV